MQIGEVGEAEMSNRPTAVNGKRNRAWGTTSECAACGECLCFACHPQGPCVDEHASIASDAETAAGASAGPTAGAWPFRSEGSFRLAGLPL